MATNQDYLDLWENSAPTPVDSRMTPEEIKKAQGTRNNIAAPWETYNPESDPDITPELQRQIDEYAKNVHDSSSNQNKEELHRWQEQNADIAKEYQWVTPDEYADHGARIGTIMHSSDFITRLQQAGVKCWYRFHGQPRKITLMVVRPGKEPEVGCWCQLGFAPELSIMSFDEHGIPLAEKFRGWRTPLLQLILKSVITEEKADEVFGKPKQTEAFNRYNSTLQSFRCAGSRIG